MGKKLKLDILYLGNEDLLVNEIGNHVYPTNISIIRVLNFSEFSVLCETYDFELILVDFKLENYQECYSFAKKAKKVMEENQITAKLCALSSISVTSEIIVKNDFDDIFSLDILRYLDVNKVNDMLETA